MTYELDSGKGYAVLLVYEKFKHVNNRKGSEKDFENMKYLTKSLGLEQNNLGHEKNLTRDETLKVLEDARNSLITKDDCQMFVFMISTHGEESANNAAAGQKDHALVCSDDKKIFLSTDVVKRFSDHNCPVLKGKPKLFFIQACRSVHHTWYMEKGTKLINTDAKISTNRDKTTITVARDKDNNYETKQSIDVEDIAQIHTSKSSDNIKDSKEFHLVLKGGKGKEEFIASTQDHADAWVIVPKNSVSSILAKRIWMDGKEENGHVRFQKRLNGILWDYCSSDVTGVAGGAGSQTSADLLTMERENKDEIEADTTGRYDNETKVLGFTQPLQDMNINTGTDDVILSCKTNCPNVKWGKDGKPIESTTRVKIEQKGFVHQLKFTKVENGDSGLYTCSISKDCSTSSSLNVGGLTKRLQNKYLDAGTENVTLSCTTNSDKVKWKKR
ncbi:CASPA-like protein [Mya arenaria]|uniref:CASPA-like protein n=1 Tax=Mya arenaria TaxID=6604 RepID=A0ABY7G4G5_MYAAR|nr:CASPA-like protein [Mya arenaria]